MLYASVCVDNLWFLCHKKGYFDPYNLISISQSLENQERVMDQQERQIISDIFERLRQVETQPRDAETENFIQDKIKKQPYAPYALAQTIYVQEQAVLNLQSQVDELLAQVQSLQRNQEQKGGFLSRIFSDSAPQPMPRTQAAPSARGGFGSMSAQNPTQNPTQNTSQNPWGAPAAPMQQQGGGFLQGAMKTAAGVAGGMVLGNILMNAFSSGSAQAAPAQTTPSPQKEEQAANSEDNLQDNFQDGSYDAADYSGSDDGGMDFGGGDWA
jgi:uncharacterized protein